MDNRKKITISLLENEYEELKKTCVKLGKTINNFCMSAIKEKLTNEISSWKCDKCGEIIAKAEDGIIDWKQKIINYNLEKSCYGIRIVHQNCLYNDNNYDDYTISDMPIQKFLGHDGLMDLLAMLSDNLFSNNKEILEIIKRLHINGYEQARFFFDEAISNNVFEPNSTPYFFSQNNIKATLDYSKKNKR